MRRLARVQNHFLAVIGAALATVGLAAAQKESAPVATLTGHTDPVYAVTWSPSGDTLATAGFDNTVRLWDSATWKEIRTYEGHTKLVLTVAYSPDGRQLASGSLDHSVRIWDLPARRPEKTIPGLSSSVRALAAKPDGKQILVAADRNVTIWDTAKGVVHKELGGHAGEVTCAAWRQDGTQFGTGEKSPVIRLWKGDLSADGVIETSGPDVLGLAYVPGKPLLVSAGADGLARLWQLPASPPRRLEAKGAVLAFAASLDGARIAAAGADRIVRIWTPADGKLVKEIAGNDQAVLAVAFGGKGNQVAFALSNKVLRICSADDGKELKRVGPFPAEITALAFRDDGAQIAAACSDKVIRVLAADGKPVKALKAHADRITALSYAPQNPGQLFSG
jgi:WD40 repeat protein